MHTTLPRALLFALMPAVLFVSAAELVVRATGAADTCGTFTDHPLFTCDPLLHYRLRPDFRAGDDALNAAGFRGRALGPKAPGTLRLLALGDSCTFGLVRASPQAMAFPEPYPQLLERLVAERGGPGRFDVVNAGSPGYNTWHGIMLLRTKLGVVDPDVVTIRYEWNDLLASDGVAPGAFRERTGWARRAEDVLLRTALYPFARRLGIALGGNGRTSAAAPPASSPRAWTPNVPPEQFRTHLRRLVELVRAGGARPWLLTVPDAFATAEFRGRAQAFAATASQQLGLIRLAGIPSFERLAAIVAEYNAIVRAVAAELDATLVDVAAAYAASAIPGLFGDYDAIHPTAAGHALEAELLYRELLAQGLLPSGGSPHAAAPPGGRRTRAA